MTIKDDLVMQIQHDITVGILKPGEQLKVLDLKIKYNTGGTPIREALNELVGTHLIFKKNTCGFIVAPLSLEDFNDLYCSKEFVEQKLASDSLKNNDEEWELGIVSSHYALSKLEHDGVFADDLTFEIWNEKLKKFKSSIYCKARLKKIIYFYYWLEKQQLRYRYLWFNKNKYNREIISLSFKFHLELKDAALERNENKTLSNISEHNIFLINSLTEFI
jgi:GntR family transcriptional regulator, carbon starvation induced regulator